jgi:hypothetical protein
MARNMSVNHIYALSCSRELDAEDTFAIINGLCRAFSLRARLAIGDAIFVKQRVVAVVREPVSVVLATLPAVVKAVPITICFLHRCHADLGYSSLPLHCLFRVVELLKRVEHA